MCVCVWDIWLGGEGKRNKKTTKAPLPTKKQILPSFLRRVKLRQNARKQGRRSSKAGDAGKRDGGHGMGAGRKIREKTDTPYIQCCCVRECREVCRTVRVTQQRERET
ncbi:Uncharacterized protein APZ42_019791 [Daphnia magna]|uniref:Uncharacterized protein n=1 Tax=Daphnia magna TaxID=35525 RepID=A0A162CDH5_9CRUS|nr:Uncharacterized protein APZ42_019791 [Daphnia magna]